jgi:hypothetical protein
VQLEGNDRAAQCGGAFPSLEKAVEPATTRPPIRPRLPMRRGPAIRDLMVVEDRRNDFSPNLTALPPRKLLEIACSRAGIGC